MTPSHDNPPPGYGPCTRAAGHSGPCAHPFTADPPAVAHEPCADSACRQCFEQPAVAQGADLAPLVEAFGRAAIEYGVRLGQNWQPGIGKAKGEYLITRDNLLAALPRKKAVNDESRLPEV